MLYLCILEPSPYHGIEAARHNCIQSQGTEITYQATFRETTDNVGFSDKGSLKQANVSIISLQNMHFRCGFWSGRTALAKQHKHEKYTLTNQVRKERQFRRRPREGVCE